MIVEFIGSTGAGKTTLISKAQKRLEASTAVTTSFDLVAHRVGMNRATHPTIRNLIQEVVGFPFFLGAIQEHQSFVSFMLQMYSRQPKASVSMLNNLRSLERKLGVYAIARKFQDGRIVLVDEGTVLSAHNVFVFSNADYSEDELSTFAGLVPLPDIIIYVRAPVDVLVDRSLRRPDPPREMRARDRELVRRHVSRAADMFERLVRSDRLRQRVLAVENPGSDLGDQELTVERIVSYIQSRYSMDESNPEENMRSIATIK